MRLCGRINGNCGCTAACGSVESACVMFPFSKVSVRVHKQKQPKGNLTETGQLGGGTGSFNILVQLCVAWFRLSTSLRRAVAGARFVLQMMMVVGGFCLIVDTVAK